MLLLRCTLWLACAAPVLAQAVPDSQLPLTRHGKPWAVPEHAVVIQLDQRGRLFLADDQVGFDALRARLEQESERRADGSLRPSILIRAAQTVPVAAVAILLDAVASDGQGLDVWLGARADPLAFVALPYSLAPIASDTRPVVGRLAYELPAPRTPTLADSIRDVARDRDPTHMELRSEPAVEFQHAVAAFDAARDAGIDRVALEVAKVGDDDVWQRHRNLELHVDSVRSYAVPVSYVVGVAPDPNAPFEQEPAVPEYRRDPSRRGRIGGLRSDRSRLYGGDDEEVAIAIKRAMNWIEAQQHEDGTWKIDRPAMRPRIGDQVLGSIGLTALAVLTMLTDGSTLRVGDYKPAVRLGIIWLRNKQDRETGQIGRSFEPSSALEQALAAYAMIEAHGQSDYKILKKNAVLSMRFIEGLRDEGGWRYGGGDALVTAWFDLVLDNARFFGLEPEGLDRKVGATVPGGPVGREAAALFVEACRGRDPQREAVERVSRSALALTPRKDAEDAMSWFFVSLALSRAGGEAWERWKPVLDTRLVSTQLPSGGLVGTWVDPADAEVHAVYTTAMLCLALQRRVRAED